MSDTDDQKGFFKVNAWWWASAAVLVIVVIAGIAIAVLPSHNSTATSPATTTPAALPTTSLSSPTPSPSLSTTAAGSGWADLGCNGTKGATKEPTSAPVVTWVPVGTLSAPTSSVLGPRRAAGYSRNCYQHSPAGAVLAATNALVVIRTVPLAQRETVVTRLMTAGAGRDEVVKSAPPSDSAVPEFAAFDIQSCSPERCNVRLILNVGSRVSYGDLSMVWSGGDWLLDGEQAPTGGGLTSVPTNSVTWSS